MLITREFWYWLTVKLYDYEVVDGGGGGGGGGCVVWKESSFQDLKYMKNKENCSYVSSTDEETGQ